MCHPDGITNKEAFYPYGIMTPEAFHFQVEAPVTRRSPHRPVREDFPHTVPRFQLFYQVGNQTGDTPFGV